MSLKFDFKIDEMTRKWEVKLNAIHFKSKNPKEITIFMHGNYGNIEHFNSIIKPILDLNYDLLIYDYRGYGKSSGKIKSEKEF